VSLTDDELERYARHIVLPQVGGVGQNRLRAASVAIVGAGGIGSAIIPALAGAGVGRLTIIDGDTVAIDNLHRQTIFTEADAGKAKADCAASVVSALNRHVAVRAIAHRIVRDNAGDLLAGHDLVIDGSDNFATRLAVGDACVALGLPLVSAAAIQLQGQVGLWRGRPCYRCFAGDAFDSDDCDNCAELGVLGPLAAATGAFAAVLAVNVLADVGPDQAGFVHLFDGEKLLWRTIRVPAEPACLSCA
jgi:molybdopterin/thiamine biosynthesis adenylyltransferase